jgi:hypothetical protein
MKTKLVKKQIRKSPAILFQKPWFVFYIPFIIYDSIKIRWHFNKTKVLLISGVIEEIVENYTVNNELEFNIINTFSDFVPLAKKRLLEDNTIDSDYLDAVKKRFDKGEYVSCLAKDNNVVSFSFISERRMHVGPVNMTINLPLSTFSYTDVYTFKEGQGKGYYKELYMRSLLYMQSKGFINIWGLVMEHNQVSVKVHCNIGLNKVIKICEETIRYGFTYRRIYEVNTPLHNYIK